MSEYNTAAIPMRRDEIIGISCLLLDLFAGDLARRVEESDSDEARCTAHVEGLIALSSRMQSELARLDLKASVN